MYGCAGLCKAVLEWSGHMDRVWPFVQSLNYPYFVFSYCGGFMGTLLET
jgi:hypothetical protein